MALPILALWCIAALCIGLAFAYDHTLHPIFQRIAQVFINATWNGPLGISIGFAFLGHAIDSLDNSVRQALYAGIEGGEWAWHQTLYAITVAYQDIADTVHGVAIGSEQALRYLRHHALPIAISVALGPITPLLNLLQQQVRELWNDRTKVTAPITKVIYRDVPQALTRAEEASIAALVHVPAAVSHTVIDVVGAGTGYLDRELGALRKRLDQLAKDAAPGALIGAAAAAVLGSLGLGWLKCSNVGRFGRKLCGLDRGVLDALLLGLTAVFGTLGLVKFAEDVQGVTGEFQGLVTGFWRATVSGPGGDRALGVAGGTDLSKIGAPGPGGDRALGQPGA